MLVTCDNKGCLKSTDAQYNTETKEVICLACEQPINNVSDSMKRVLSTSGQIVRNEVKKSFVMGCMSCYANREIVLTDDDKTVCAVCFEPITVHASMRLALQETNTKLRQMTEDEKATMKAKKQPAEKPKSKTTNKKKRRRRTSKKKQ